ncbi:MAG: class I SAM-dependent methyltransferase [Thermoanaerobaculia bacterium]|nr:class I SAM-dependent methyltransferase [Thermoanaerobaculia bacterium]
MSDRARGVYRLLGWPRFYEAFQQVLGARALRKRFVDDFLRPFSGARLLDVGCGPGSLLADLPSGVEYIGFDVNPRYIEEAQRRYRGRGRFFCASIEEGLPGLGQNTFDFVVARSLLHHLNDEEANQLLASARRHLRPGGTFVSSDPTFHDGQSVMARAVISFDRGRHVRSPEAYRSLAEGSFDSVEMRVIQGALRIPYSHCVMIAKSSA